MNSSDHGLYGALWKLGEISGCHQRADRSFFLRGRQFPVCARCTGAAIGQLTGALLFYWYRIPVWLCVLLCGVMFGDWLLQRLDILPSANWRRLLTGIGCGGALIQLYFRFLTAFFDLIM